MKTAKQQNSNLRLTASGSTTLQGTFEKTGAFANRRWLYTTSKLALASLLLTIFTACPSSSSSSGPVAPTLSGDYAFTYNTQASLMINNSGGAVGSYELASGSTLPTGLALDIKDGQLFVEGTPTKVTLNTAKAQIAAVPLQISVTGSGGTTMAMVTVTVNPKFVTGDQSMGITHVATDGVNHTHQGVTHQHAGPAANSPLIHVANNISFASGGTGAATDPVLIGVASGATSLSFVVDYNNVMIPNFDATSNDTFLIQLLGIPINATIANIELEYMEALDTNTQMRFAFPPYVSSNTPVTFVRGADNVGMNRMIMNSTETVKKADKLLMRLLQFNGSGIQGTLDGRMRYTVTITQPSS